MTCNENELLTVARQSMIFTWFPIILQLSKTFIVNEILKKNLQELVILFLIRREFTV